MNFGNKILLKILDKVNIPIKKCCIFHKYNILDSHLSDCGYFIVEYKCKKCGKIKRKLRF